MKNKTIKIRNGSIGEVVALSQKVPEFFQPYSEITYHERLTDRIHLILVAEIEGGAVGFKVGYESATPGVFYSWMGGVLATCRRMGIASRLADFQEEWARNHGYQKVQFKTRNSFGKMIHFGLNRGFMITDLIKKGQVKDYRIVMEKLL